MKPNLDLSAPTERVHWEPYSLSCKRNKIAARTIHARKENDPSCSERLATTASFRENVEPRARQTSRTGFGSAPGQEQNFSGRWHVAGKIPGEEIGDEVPEACVFLPRSKENRKNRRASFADIFRGKKIGKCFFLANGVRRFIAKSALAGDSYEFVFWGRRRMPKSYIFRTNHTFGGGRHRRPSHTHAILSHLSQKNLGKATAEAGLAGANHLRWPIRLRWLDT